MTRQVERPILASSTLSSKRKEEERKLLRNESARMVRPAASLRLEQPGSTDRRGSSRGAVVERTKSAMDREGCSPRRTTRTPRAIWLQQDQAQESPGNGLHSLRRPARPCARMRTGKDRMKRRCLQPCGASKSAKKIHRRAPKKKVRKEGGRRCKEGRGKKVKKGGKRRPEKKVKKAKRSRKEGEEKCKEDGGKK
uniref:Uncharacterized protein n=1 Tax=Macrostomum lignano TaxID=282301 RepID=A0A1I8JMB2_9PLAT